MSTICVKSKATRGKHSGINDTGLSPGQAYGAVITDPFVLPSLTGNIYMFAITDYATRRDWRYFIITKDEAFVMTFGIELVRARAANGELDITILITDEGEFHSITLHHSVLSIMNYKIYML